MFYTLIAMAFLMLPLMWWRKRKKLEQNSRQKYKNFKFPVLIKERIQNTWIRTLINISSTFSSFSQFSKYSAKRDTCTNHTFQSVLLQLTTKSKPKVNQPKIQSHKHRFWRNHVEMARPIQCNQSHIAYLLPNNDLIKNQSGTFKCSSLLS